jgi:hypothetical protein
MLVVMSLTIDLRPGAADRLLLLSRLPRWYHPYRDIRCGCPFMQLQRHGWDIHAV